MPITVTHNIFQNPSTPIAFQCTAGVRYGQINAAYNWWGTNVGSMIQAEIYDFFVNSNYGVVNFSPFLNDSFFGAPAVVVSSSLLTVNTTWGLSGKMCKSQHNMLSISSAASYQYRCGNRSNTNCIHFPTRLLTLQILPGVVIQLGPSASILVLGVLNATGNATDPITFINNNSTFYGSILLNAAGWVFINTAYSIREYPCELHVSRWRKRKQCSYHPCS